MPSLNIKPETFSFIGDQKKSSAPKVSPELPAIHPTAGRGRPPKDGAPGRTMGPAKTTSLWVEIEQYRRVQMLAIEKGLSVKETMYRLLKHAIEDFDKGRCKLS